MAWIEIINYQNFEFVSLLVFYWDLKTEFTKKTI